MIESIAYAAKLVKAPPPRTSDEWAADNRIMPPSSPRPGKFNPNVNRYMRPVAEAAVKPQYDKYTFITATQMGKSVTMENIIGHTLDEDPTPVMYVAPTAPLLKDAVIPKFDDMIAECKSLTKKLNKRKSTTFVKWIAGTKLRFVWAGSPSGLSADSVGRIFVDEVDRIVNTGEGSTMIIVERRGDAYDGSKIFYTATPTHGRVAKRRHEKTGLEHWDVVKAKGLGSTIWKLWQSGTRHEWAVPCPECHEYFIPHSGLLWWPGKDSEKECTPDEAQKHARLTCGASGCEIQNKYRPWMNERGRAVAPGQSITRDGDVIGVAETASSTHFTYLVSGLCSFSSKKTYGALAKDLLSARISADPNDLQAVYNTGFGECYAQGGDVPTWEVVQKARYGYAEGVVLLPPLNIFCTIDVQGNRLVYVVRAWYPGMGSMLLEHGELWGKTDQAPVWDDLAELLYRDFDGYAISLMGIDCGYRDDMVYDFIHAHPGRAIALRGRESLPMPFRKELIEQSKQGKVRKKGDSRWAFDSTGAKRWVHSRFNVPDDRPGFWLLHQQVSEDYCRQIVGEEWRESEGKFAQVDENHYLDCEGMQYVLALREKINRRKRGVLSKAQLPAAIRKAGGEIEEAPEPVEPPEVVESSAPEPAAPRPSRKPAAPAPIEREAAAEPERAKRPRFKFKRKL